MGERLSADNSFFSSAESIKSNGVFAIKVVTYDTVDMTANKSCVLDIELVQTCSLWDDSSY